MVDLSRGTTGAADLLPKEISTEIWADAQEQSAVMQLATPIRVPGTGLTIPIITGDASADWVAETAAKPVSRATLGKKVMTPYKLAVIETFSDEFRRDLPGVYAELRRRLPGAIAKKFDQTVFGTSAPGSGFDTLGGATAVPIAPHATDVKKNTYSGLVKAYTDIADAGGTLDGWALSSKAKGLLLGQVDSTGRPLLFNDIQAGSPVGSLLGEPVYYTQGVNNGTTIGFAGDWSSAYYGTVEGIKFDISNQASIVDGSTTYGSGDDAVVIPNVIHLWAQNMFAVLVEVEIGFIARDVNRFRKITNATIS